LKRLVAYTSVSHLGFVVLGIFAFHQISVQGAVFQMLNHGISTGALFLGLGMLYDRRHTYLISEFGGLATPMPALAALYLFSCFASAGLPMLNGFVGEFLILSGTFQKHAAWASWATLGVIFSSVYLLWSYQRVFYGSVTQDKNAKLPDLDLRERGTLVLMAALMLFMGIRSPFFTRRTEASTQNILHEMQRPQAYNAGGTPGGGINRIDLDHAPAAPHGMNTAAIGSAANSVNLK
jgi:NADH-quinone oxidoreductase subunit M